ncbi:MAG: ABC transporter transmembrane domain-containing protein, partial [Alphaproteobacteria bacterium]
MDPAASARLADVTAEPAAALPDLRSACRLRLLRNPSILLSSLGVNLMSLALPLVLLQVYQRIIPNASLDTFAYLLGGMAAVVLLDGLLRAARSYVIAWQGSRFEHLLGRAAVQHLTEAPLHAFNDEPVGRHLERLQAIDIVRDFYGGSGLVNLLEAPFVLLFLAMIFAISGPLGFVPLGLFVICGGVAYLVGRKVRAQIERRNKVDIQRFNFILEVLNGLAHVKSQAFESFMQRRYERLQGACAVENGALARLSAMSHSCGAFFSYFVLFATAAAGAYMVLDGDLSQGALAAASLLAGRATQPFIRSMAFWTEYQTVSVARRNLAAIFAYQPESAAYGAREHRLDGRIDLDRVTKSYDDGAPVLDALSLAIEPGEFVLIDGAIGSGKSTLLRLIAGLSRPTSGAIAFDGVGMEELQPALLRRQVAYLPEHAVLFRGTILDNLTLFQPEKHLERAMELAAALQLDHAIAKLPDGFETEVGDD